MSFVKKLFRGKDDAKYEAKTDDTKDASNDVNTNWDDIKDDVKDDTKMNYYDEYNLNDYVSIPKKALLSKNGSNKNGINTQNNESILNDNGIDRRYKINNINTNIKLNNNKEIPIDLGKYIIHIKTELNNSYSNGTGTIINIKHNTVYILTAAHVISRFDKFSAKGDIIKPDNIWCYINNKWYHTNICYVYNKYKNDGISQDINDFGIIKLYIPDSFMFYSVFPKLVTYNDINNNNNNECFIYGYPGEYINDSTGVAQLYGMSGNYSLINNNKYNNELIYYDNIDTSGGQSGSPIFIYNNCIIGIHTMGNDFGDNKNYACIFNKNKINWINNIINNNNNNSNNNINITPKYTQYMHLAINNDNLKHEWINRYDIFDSKGTRVKDKCTYFAYTGSSYFFIQNNILFVKGDNQWSQLGTNKKIENINDSIKHDFFKENIDIQWISNSLTASHCFVYTKKKQLYGFGLNGDKQIGLKRTGIEEYKPLLIKYNFGTSLKQIQTGYKHTLFLCQNANVYGCGLNDCLQLSNAYKKRKNNYSIQKIINTQNIKSIKCCGNSSYFLNSNNILSACGNNESGELGIKNKSINKSGSIEVILKQIKTLDCGSFHIGCLTLKNKLYMFGNNLDYQCGLNNIDECHLGNEIILLNTNDIILDIKCARHHSIIKTNNNNYYSFGKNDYGELLIENNDYKVYIPRKISLKYLHSITKSNNAIIDLFLLKCSIIINIE